MDTNEPHLPHDAWETPGAAGRALNQPAEPPPGQWAAIEARMSRDRRRRGLLWLWPLALLLAGGGVWWGVSRQDEVLSETVVASRPALPAAIGSEDLAGLGTPPSTKTQDPVALRQQEAGQSVQTTQAEAMNQPKTASAPIQTQPVVAEAQPSTSITKPVTNQTASSRQKPVANGLVAAIAPRHKTARQPMAEREEPGQMAHVDNPPAEESSDQPTAALEAGKVAPSPAYPVNDAGRTEQSTPVAATVAGREDDASPATPEGQNSADPSPVQGSEMATVAQAAAALDSVKTDSAVVASNPVLTVKPDSVARPEEKKEASESRFYFGLGGLSYAGRYEVEANAELAPAQYRLTRLGEAWGAMAKVGYHIPFTPALGLSVELDAGVLTQQGSYRVQPGGTSGFTYVVSADSLGYAAQPQATTGSSFRATTGLLGTTLLFRYRLGRACLSAGGRVWGYAPLSGPEGGTSDNGLSVQPVLGLGLRLRQRLSLDGTVQPFSLSGKALPLPLSSSSRGWLYSLGLSWNLP